MKSLLTIAKIAVGAAAITVTMHANAQQTTYDWTGGEAGFSGQIILDSNGNTAGNISDIVSATITTPQGGPFDFNPTTVYIDVSPFTWNQTQITNMWIDWTVGSTEVGMSEGNVLPGNSVASNNGYEPYVEDSSGSWTAVSSSVPSSVPDGGATIALLSASLTGLAALRRRFAK